MISIGLHEIGHLVPAKKFGLRVSQYMIGFGPTLWSKIRGETEYGVKGIPLGGYIRIIGMFPPNPKGPADWDTLGPMQRIVEGAREQSLSEVVPGEESRAFYNLSTPKKITIMLGGPLMNLILAGVLFAITLSAIGSPQATTTVATVVECVPTDANPNGIVSTSGECVGSPKTAAAGIGLKTGDRILKIDGDSIKSWQDIAGHISARPGRSVSITYVREWDLVITKVATISTVKTEIRDAQGNPTGEYQTRGLLGVSPILTSVREPLSRVPGILWDTTTGAYSALWNFPKAIFSLGRTLSSDQTRDPNGPVSIVGIGQVTGAIVSSPQETVSSKIRDVLLMMASLNVFLFVFNTLPILPLDGGHVAGAIYEGIKRLYARLRGKPRPAPVDTAKMWPVAYIVTLFLIAMSLVTIVADIVKPINLG